MSGMHTVEQQKLFEHLAGVVSLQGWRDFEVSLDNDELRIERHGRRAACTIVMLPDEPTFQVHFVFSARSAGPFSFNIGREAARRTAQAATKQFGDAEEAARWLLDFLKTPDTVVDR